MTAPYDLPPRLEPAGALPPLEVGPRADRVRARMAAAGIDALLVTDLTNVRWLTGFTGSAGRALLLPDELVLVTDGRYEERAAEELAAAGRRPASPSGGPWPSRWTCSPTASAASAGWAWRRST